MEKPTKSVRRKGHAVTIDAVAAHAGVSPMTVSRVVNNRGMVRDATRERVLRAVRELGYRPNLAASALAAAQHTCIALIYTNPSSAYLRELLVGALNGSNRTATQLVIADWDTPDAESPRTAARLLARSVAGVILPPPLCESRSVVMEFVRAGVPVVSIASGQFDDAVSCVRIDDFQASKEMAAYLIARGHVRIGYIKGNPDQTTSGHRLEGFRAALAEAGLPLDGELVQQGYYTYRSGLDAAEKLLSLDNRPTAIFASNDDMAAAAVSVAHRRGMSVPRDLSVVGFDNTSAATTVWPELTTIQQPIASMADAAIDILLHSIRRPEKNSRATVNRVMPHELIVRDSVASLYP